MQLTLGYPWVAVLLCGALGITYAAILYYRDRRFEGLLSGWRILMATLRAIFVALLSFFLLEPYLRFTEIIREPPLILIAQDASRSIALGDRSFDYSAYRREIQMLADKLNDDYEVRLFHFGEGMVEGLPDSLNEPLTNYTALLNDWSDRFAHRNIGALIVATDGRFNRGGDPRYQPRTFDAPTFTVALGDTSQRRDAFISEVRHNELAFLGNRFPVQVVARANGLQGEKLAVTLSTGGRTLAMETVTPGSDRCTETINFELGAAQTGLHRYIVQISSPVKEQNIGNNQSEFYIEVIDTRHKILLLTSAPHPDLAALRSALQQNERYEVQQKFIGRDMLDPSEYNLIIQHKPDFSGQEALWNKIQSGHIAVWTITGAQLNGSGAPWQPLIRIVRQGDETDEVTPIVAAGFAPFQLQPETYDWFRNLPPLNVPFGTYTVNPGTEVLLQQQVGTITTERPLVAYGDWSGKRWAVVCGEGLWRWRLADYQMNQTNEHFDDWILRTAQYLASSGNRSRFRIESDHLFDENQNVALRAEVYNAAFQPITEPEVRIVLSNEAGQEFPFTFTRQANAYGLNVGILPIGSYTWEARTGWGGESFIQRGAFTVRALEWEQRDLQANHALLQQWSAATGGEMVPASDMLTLEEIIRADKSAKPVLYEQNVLEELIEQRYFFFVLLGFISLEWFLRKRNGGY